jgi:hypothetical protein
LPYLEHIEQFKNCLPTADNQFGVKKGLGCTHAIYTVQIIAYQLVKGGISANLSAIDQSKAFDKTNHHSLFIKSVK